MDNREFAKVLLSEAASLLEGAQAEAYKTRKAKDKADIDEQDRSNAVMRNVRKDIAMTCKDKPGHYKEVREARKKYNSRLLNDAEKYIYSDKIFTNREIANRLNVDNAITRRAERDLKKKAQNESVTTLLMEAADLLNESADFDMYNDSNLLNESIFSKIKEKTFATKKETDDIVKQYTSIEGLHKYAPKKDAIIEFTKIKQGLNTDSSFDFTIKKINDANVMYAFGKNAQEDMVIFVYIAVIDKKEKVKALEKTPGQLRKIIKKKSK